MARRARIAIVDDEPDLAEAFAEYLSDLGHQVDLAPSAAHLDRLMTRASLDLIILDLNMPGEHGLDTLRRLRADEDAPPVLILTANSDSIDKIVGLELGADDYVVKPVDPRELAARATGLLKRYGRADRELVLLERVTVDLTASRLLRDDGAPERLTPGEIALIRAFVRRPGHVLTRDELMELAPAEALDAFDRAIDTRIARLRRKLDTASIETVRGRGYMFTPPTPGQAAPGPAAPEPIAPDPA
ncbi:MAG TPA: response regulator [Beijerinckiaceae bacterium]|jgi:DNA-binding response OmpR family regulator